MSRLADAVSIALLIGAGGAFVGGVAALAASRDLEACYWLVVGALCLKGCVDLVRPRVGGR